MKISSLTSRPSSRSITQSITGRPATLSSGLGTRCVCGRSRVPLPASGMITCMSVPSVAILEPHQIIQLRRGGLQHVAVHHGLDLVNELRWDVHRVARLEWPRHQRFTRFGSQDELTPKHVHRFILLVVILQAEYVTRLHVKDFSHIAV